MPDEHVVCKLETQVARLEEKLACASQALKVSGAAGESVWLHVGIIVTLAISAATLLLEIYRRNP